MNLQITVPYETCPFKCPFCIANNPKVVSIFPNEYDLHYQEYMNNLSNALLENEIKTVIITGDTEPTLNMAWIWEVTRLIKQEFPEIKIEVQTRNYNEKALHKLNSLPIDVIALSVFQNQQVEQIRSIRLYGTVKRLVVVVNKDFNTDISYEGFNQVTFKQIQCGENEEINAWIRPRMVEFKLNENVMAENPQIGFMYDENCMDNKNRYLIFREDGQTYDSWTSTKAIW
jgi:hypothetical protein